MTRRLIALAAVAVGAAAAVAALVVLGGDRDDGSTQAPSGRLAGVADARALLRGIPQDGDALGRRDAPVTLVEYVDPQCPFCAQYATQVAPTLVRDYVRTGRLRIVQRVVPILGPDSETAATWARAARRRDRQFGFTDLLFRNQGSENSGWVTGSLLRRVARGAGLDPGATARAAAGLSPPSAAGVSSTPSFLIGRTGSELRPLQVASLAPREFTTAIDRLAR